MATKKLTLSDVNKKHLKIIGYLLASGILGYLLSLLVGKPELFGIFGPIVNYVIYSVEKELKSEGYIKVVRG